MKAITITQQLIKKLLLITALLLGLLLNAQKAITVTQQLKDLNTELFSNTTVNTIRVFNSLPKTFYRLGNNGARTDAYNLLNNSEHQADGFYDLTTPVYNTATQHLGNIYFDTDHFTYTVIDYTAQELSDIQAQQADQTAGITETTRSDDGTSETLYIYKMLRKLKNNGTLTTNQFIGAQDLMFDALLPMTYGLWDVSKSRLDAVSNPANATLLNILNKIRARIDYYIANGTRQVEQ